MYGTTHDNIILKGDHSTRSENILTSLVLTHNCSDTTEVKLWLQN